MKNGSVDHPVTPVLFPFFYDKGIWSEYLDFLAENRFNQLILWNAHPFDYFVELPDYPETKAGLGPGVLNQNREMLKWLIVEAARRNIKISNDH